MRALTELWANPVTMAFWVGCAIGWANGFWACYSQRKPRREL